MVVQRITFRALQSFTFLTFQEHFWFIVSTPYGKEGRIQTAIEGSLWHLAFLIS